MGVRTYFRHLGATSKSEAPELWNEGCSYRGPKHISRHPTQYSCLGKFASGLSAHLY